MAEKKNNIIGNIAKFFRECKSEIKKIVWPASKSTLRNTGIVLVVIFLIGLFVFGLDTVLLNLLGTVMSVSK